ncbi:hypothetical protein [Lacinutrix sp. Hel_I_90]|uniref:hypothetical protein n=1 Tax=Lacinutrix sp. Hel_I_90 TaxID=1249999 RepID=UPI0005CAE84E|nr:hypothetical protein [Lacinutrix sp. Hel_I_90]
MSVENLGKVVDENNTAIPNISINLSYMYRNDKTKIRTSSNLQSRFDRAQFSNFGIGINFQFGKAPVISGLKK